MTLETARPNCQFFSVLLLIMQVFSASIGPQAASAQSTDTLYFTLDLRGPIGGGWFDPVHETAGLRGDHPPLSWSTTFPASDPDGNGLFEVALPVEVEFDSQSIGYKIKIDGVENPNDGWQAGANHVVTIRRGQSQIVSLAWEDELAPRSTITGHIEVLENVRFEGLAPRDVFVYLPPGYDESDRRYPVLYLNDGQNVFDASASGEEWRVDETAERLIRSGSIEPIIIVGIGNTSNRIDEYTPTEQRWHQELQRVSSPLADGNPVGLSGDFANRNEDTLRVKARDDTLFVQLPGYDLWQIAVPVSDSTFFIPRADITLQFDQSEDEVSQRVVATKSPQGGNGALYARFIVEKLKPLIDTRFRTRPDTQSTGLGGSSLGGLITLYMGLEYPHLFGKLLVVSPSVWWDDRWIVHTVQDYAGPTNQQIWLDIGLGEGDRTVANSRALNEALTAAGWPTDRLRYVEIPDAHHNERSWAARVPEMLKYLFPQ